MVITKNILQWLKKIPDVLQEFFRTNIEKIIILSNGTIELGHLPKGKGDNYAHIYGSGNPSG